MIYFNVYQTDVGELTILEENGSVIQILFGAINVENAHNAESAVLVQAIYELNQYFAGQRKVIEVPFYPLGATDFDLKVYQALFNVPYGDIISLSELAYCIKESDLAKIKKSLKKNPLPIFIPCHRVINDDGTLGDYIGGKKLKEALIKFEKAHKDKEFVPETWVDPIDDDDF